MRFTSRIGKAGVATLVAGLLAVPLLATPVAAGSLPSAGDVELTSIDTGSGGGRELPAMSADGSRVVFVGRGENNGVWLRDRNSDTSYRLTSGSHFNPAISADGNTVAYVVYGSARSVFAIDITDPSTPGAPVLVSKNAEGTAANALSDFPSLSADARYVAFQSTGSNLDPSTPLPGSGGPTKVYVHDRDVAGDGTFDQPGDIDTFMVSVTGAGIAPPGNAAKPDITPDGSVVVFGSEQVLAEVAPAGAVPAVEEEEADTAAQVWKVTVASNDVTSAELMSKAGDGSPGDLGSALDYGPTVSDDGSVVAFESEATNLAADDTNDDLDAFINDDGVVTRISVDGRTATKGAQIDLEPQLVVPCTGLPWTDENLNEIVPMPVVGAGPQVSGDGTFVAFDSDAALTVDDLNDTTAEFGTVRITDVYGYDIAGGQVERLSQPVPTGLEATGCRPEGSTGILGPMNNGTDAAIGSSREFVSFVSNGDLADERPDPVEPAAAPAVEEEEESSAEPAIHTRTYGPLDVGMFARDTVAPEHDTSTNTVEVLIGLTQPASGPITVDVNTVDGTAIADVDYVPLVDQEVSFATGEISTNVEVEIIGDIAIEPDEDFFVELSNATIPVGAPLATVTILDDDDVASFNQHFRSVPFSMGGDFKPLVGDFDGSGVSDVFWYAPGSAADRLWRDVTPTLAGFELGSDTPEQINGTYEPFVGDFDDDGFDDIFWYAPGTAKDYIWYGGVSGPDSRQVTVNGTYRPVVTEAEGQSAIVWYAPGGARDYLWIGAPDRTFSSPAVKQINGTTYRPVAIADPNHEPGILWYAPGTTSDWVWGGLSVSGGSPAVNQKVTINGDYQPLAQYPAAMLYGPGSLPDVAVGFDLFGPGFASLPATVNGVYRPGAGPDLGLIVWYQPGTGTDYLWMLID
ncbi:MAG TPA: Calx-beta domain-containing protein [Acidimicrobiales bacterium]|nr:Calx-beta domain-containing protein [Acidimicrobiales bacterium]